MPATRQHFWKAKFERNVARDLCNEQLLQAAGWQVETIWECETRDSISLRTRVQCFFAPDCAIS